MSIVYSATRGRTRVPGLIDAKALGYADLPVMENLVFWLAARKITGLSDGNAVETWSDSSGNGKDATQATADNRPLYKTNIQNGLPALLFSTSDYMTMGNLSASFPTAATLFMVMNPNTDSSYNFYTTRADLNDWGAFGGTGYWGTFRAARLEGYPSGMPTDSNAHILSLVSSGSTYQAYIDGTGPNATAKAA